MKLKTKKILAREFLILTITVVIGLIAFLCIYPYNSIQKNKVEDKETAIKIKEKLADSLIKQYHEKCKNQKWFYDKFNVEYNLSNDTTVNCPEKWWKIFEDHVKADSLIIRWKTRWDKEQIDFLNKIGFDVPSKLNDFIAKNIINSSDIKNKVSAKKVYSEIKTLKNEKDSINNRIFDSSEQFYFGLWVLIISGLLLFGLRYIVYAVKWSIKTLRQKTDINSPQ